MIHPWPSSQHLLMDFSLVQCTAWLLEFFTSLWSTDPFHAPTYHPSLSVVNFQWPNHFLGHMVHKPQTFWRRQGLEFWWIVHLFWSPPAHHPIRACRLCSYTGVSEATYRKLHPCTVKRGTSCSIYSLKPAEISRSCGILRDVFH